MSHVELILIVILHDKKKVLFKKKKRAWKKKMATAPTEPPSYSGYQNLGIVHNENQQALLQNESNVTRKDFGKCVL